MYNKMIELLSNSARFPLQKEIILTDKENELYSNKTACYLCGKEFHKNSKMLIKSYISLPLYMQPI